MSHRQQGGFTAVELLVTLFVAAAFLIASYQLFSLVIRDGGQTRSESRAGNVAYDYLRRYTSSATTTCTAQTPLNNSPVTITGLVDASVTVVITCPINTAPSLSKVTATINFNNPVQTVTYGTYTNYSTDLTTITNGLVGWWRLNGNATDSISGSVGAVFGASPTSGQNGQGGTAYSFNGSNTYISIVNNPAVGNLTNNLTIGAWVRANNTTSIGTIVSSSRIGTANGIALSTLSNSTARFTTLGVRDYNSSTAVYAANSWEFIVAVMSSNNVTYFVNGIQRDTITHTVGGSINSDDPLYIGAGTVTGGTALTSPFQGSIDDVRIYNRALSPSEIQTLFNGGAF